MIVQTMAGRHFSHRTKKEKWEDWLKRYKNMTPKERKLFERLFEDFAHVSKIGEGAGFDSVEEVVDQSSFYQNLVNEHYDGRLVGLEEFIMDDHYMGAVGKHIYPRWKADLHSLFDGQYTEAIISGSIGCGKCLDGDTEFCDGISGERVTLKSVCADSGRGVATVPSFNRVTGKTEYRSAEVRLSGRKRLGTLLLASGKMIRLSPDHPVLTKDGWIQIGKLSDGELIATSREMPFGKVKFEVPDAELEFAAFMIADGACSSKNWVFSNATFGCQERFREVSSALWVRESGRNDKPGVTVRYQDGNYLELYPRGTRWIQKKYALNEKSVDKRLPSQFSSLDRRQTALFLNRIWACDGHVAKSLNVLEITLGSEQLVFDIQQMLLKTGVHSRVKGGKKSYTYKGVKKWSDAWRLSVSGARDLLLFFDSVGPILGAEARSGEVIERASGARFNSNVDVTPVGTNSSRLIRGKLGIPSTDWKFYRIPNGQRMGRAKLLEIKQRFGLPSDIDWWPDVFWDGIVGYSVDDDFSDVYDVEVSGTKNFSPNGVIVHNTTFAEMCTIRMFYEICMLRNPQASFGLMPGTEIVLVCFNRDDKLARDVTYGGVRSKLEQSPFFKEIGCKIGTSETYLPSKGIRLMAVSVRSSKALGRNVIGGIIDETDFLEGSSISGKERVIGDGDVPFAEQLHGSIIRRMKSRYERNGFLPGKLIMSSSAKNVESFTNRRIGDAAMDPYVFCRDYALYEVLPAERFAEKKFWVLVGNARIKHKILTDDEYEALSSAKLKELFKEGCRFLHVPMNFKPDFERNIEDSIRDIGGCVTVGITPFIQLRDKIYEAIDPTLKHPATSETWTTGEPPPIIWSRVCHQRVRQLKFGVKERYLAPLRHPDSPRHVHIDLSLGKTDAAGICIGHIANVVAVERRSMDGHVFVERAPMIEIDLLMRIVAPPNGEIDIGEVRGMVYHFMQRGFTFRFASMDNWQCLAAGTMVPANSGIIPIEDVEVGDLVQSRSGPKEVTNKWSFGRQKTLRIVTQDGDVLEGTGKHQIEVQRRDDKWVYHVKTKHGVTSQPKWEWRRLDEIKTGDVVRMIDEPTDFDSYDREMMGSKELFGWRNGGPESAIDEWDFPTTITPCFAEFLGLIWGDGDIGRDGVRLTVNVDEQDDARVIFLNVFGYCPEFEPNPVGQSGVFRLHARWLVRWMEHNRLFKPDIPEDIMIGSRAVKAAFLRGLFSADGSVNKSHGGVSLSTSSRDLADHVRLILRCDFGLESCLTEVERSERHYKSEGFEFVVGVRGFRSEFNNKIGFLYSGKVEKLSRFLEIKGRRKFVKVVSIEESASDVFDLEVADDPSYVANGFISHNSAETLQKLKQAGMESEKISVDAKYEPYDFLKLALYEGRVAMYHYPILLQELEKLQRNTVKGMIDHPQGGCFIGETRISLLDGSRPMILELEGKEVWVYSCTKDGRIVPGKARGRMTKMTNRLLDVVLDTGAVVRCTPEHRWMLRDGSYKEASELIPGVDRLMPISQQWSVNGGYERVADSHACRSLTHHMVYKHFNGEIPDNALVHHRNGNKTDNRPSNLKLESKSDHSRGHTALRYRTDGRYSRKVAAGLQRFNESEEGRVKHAVAMRRTMERMSPEDVRLRARSHSRFRSDIGVEQLDSVKMSKNANDAARRLGCGRNVVMRALRDAGVRSWNEFLSLPVGNNHKVYQIIEVKLNSPVPVFDLEVDEHHNFALSCGAFVHNSKDVADSLAGVVYTLSTRFKDVSPIAALGISEYEGGELGEIDDSWIRDTMQKKGDKSPVLAGDRGPIIFMG